MNTDSVGQDYCKAAGVRSEGGTGARRQAALDLGSTRRQHAGQAEFDFERMDTASADRGVGTADVSFRQ